MNSSRPDLTQAVQDRYGAAARQREACLCAAVAFDASLLAVIPVEVVDRDDGCGDPTRWVRPGDVVVDLGSGSGKNAFLCAQLVGPEGRVIGLDRNQEMLSLARWAAPMVADKIGYANVEFRSAAIERLDRDLAGAPLLADGSVDVVLSNCVLNLVAPEARSRLLGEIRRVLAPGGRVAISDIVSDRPVPLDMQQDPDLWSGCISGAWQEDRFLEDFRAQGFEEVRYAERQEQPWQVVDGIEFRSVTLVGHLPAGSPHTTTTTGCCG
jgi:arsenite methyltransferase